MPQNPELKAIADREAHPLHEAFAKWIKRNTGRSVDIDAMALALRLHPHFRESGDYQAARDKIAAARDAEAAAAHQRAQDRIAERLAKIDAAAAELRAKLEGRPAAKPKTKAKAAPRRKPAKAVEPAPPALEDAPPVDDARPARARRGRTAPIEDALDEF